MLLGGQAVGVGGEVGTAAGVLHGEDLVDHASDALPVAELLRRARRALRKT